MKSVLPDIYFLPEYACLYEKHDNAKFVKEEFSNQNGTVYNLFLKKKINVLIDGKEYFDIYTPYGYGGPVIINSDKGQREQLIEDYVNYHKNWCVENHVVTEFIRFHPLIRNDLVFNERYNVEFVRKTVATNLIDYGDPFMNEFKKSCRQKIRRAKREGMEVVFDFSGATIEEFYNIYQSTMDRNDAREYYYFDITYFNKMFELLKGHVFIANVELEDKTVASGVYMHYGKYLHAHLSGTYPDYLKLSPATLLRSEVTRWGLENGIHYFHHGGGTTNSKDDGLYRFKKNFAKHSDYEFYVAKNVWQEDVYRELVDKFLLNKKVIDNNYFPLYRAPLLSEE